MHTKNDLALMREVEERKLHKMATVDHILVMWHCSQNLHATQQDSRTQIMQLSAIGYISDIGDISKASCSNLEHHRAATFTLSKRSTLPPAVSATDLPGGRIPVLTVG
jgi:hypothetical protein